MVENGIEYFIRPDFVILVVIFTAIILKKASRQEENTDFRFIRCKTRNFQRDSKQTRYIQTNSYGYMVHSIYLDQNL